MNVQNWRGHEPSLRVRGGLTLPSGCDYTKSADYLVAPLAGNEDAGGPVSTTKSVRGARVPGGCPDQV